MKPKPPGEPKKGVVLQGHDVSEAYDYAIDPDANKKDTCLIWAKLVAGKAKAKHLHNAELRSIGWFAMLPLVADKSGLEHSVLDETNPLAVGFLMVWFREPDTVLRLLKLIRKQLHESSQWNRVSKIEGASKVTALSESDQRLLRGIKPGAHVLRAAARIRGTFVSKKPGKPPGSPPVKV